MTRNKRDNNEALALAFTVTNWSAGLSLDCNANNDLLTADTLGTLINQLQLLGIINGTVSA